jgi:DNA primase
LAKIPDNVIDAVRDRVDIVSVVGRHVNLKRVGRNHVGLCPFHNERSPSFNVSGDRRVYHCFGCGEGGDVFRFVCKVESRPFPEVVRELAKEAGVAVPEVEESPADRAREAQRQRLWALNERVLAYFRSQLAGEGGAEARTYLGGRGLDEESCRQFEVGWGGAGWDGAWQALGLGDQDREDLVAAGVCVAGDRGTYDRFRGRVVFPIRDERGRLLGFGGRVFGERAGKEGVAKYVNSSDSPVYDKSQALYRLPQALARMRRAGSDPGSGTVVVVEGYFDAIAVERRDVACVATCGTTLTPRHAQLLARHKARVILCWDGDEAGSRAVRKAGEALLAAHVPTRVAALPLGDDPDTYLERAGGEGAARLVAEAEPLPTYVVNQAAGWAEEAGDDVPRRVEAIRSTAWVFHAMPAGLERDLYLDLAAKRFRLDRAQLVAELGQRPPPPTVASPPPPADMPPVISPARTKLTDEERLITRLVAEHPEVAHMLLESGAADGLCAPVQELLFAASAVAAQSVDQGLDVPGLRDLRAAAAHPQVASIVDDVAAGRRCFSPDQVDQAIRQTISGAARKKGDDQEKRLLHEVQEAERAGDMERAQAALEALHRSRAGRRAGTRGGAGGPSKGSVEG